VLGDLTSESKEAVEIAARNSKRLLSLINDILDYERLEKGTLEMHFEHIELASIISRATETIEVVAKQQEVSLEVEKTSATIFADEDRIAQVLVNLLSNAVKFSPAKSKVIISCQETDDKVKVKVTDFGRGVPQRLHKQIFDRFKQVEASDSREKGGTGLGLAICKAIIEHHNGQIAVESQENKGSTFWFSLPKNFPDKP
jgi:signal transduction histidine kinase